MPASPKEEVKAVKYDEDYDWHLDDDEEGGPWFTYHERAKQFKPSVLTHQVSASSGTQSPREQAETNDDIFID